MMVTFVSQCEKNALKKTRRVLDAFANRIGDNTWQTVITEDGLLSVKKMLRKTASKNTAVSCHWIRSRSRSQLVWVVGNRSKFNEEGIVPVNSTARKLQLEESQWQYLPLIRALTALAALLHDWGKATRLFQDKLKPDYKGPTGDPIRHEWISCVLLDAFIRYNHQDGKHWLVELATGNIDENRLAETIEARPENIFTNHCITAQLLMWLIVSHHRLPLPKGKPADLHYFREYTADSIENCLKYITQKCGYENRKDEADFQNRLSQCFEFPQGFLQQSSLWLRDVKRWSAKLSELKPNIDEVVENKSVRLVLHHARLSLMLGDHHYSSKDKDEKWKSSIEVFANTDRKTKALKQKLDEHLVGVKKHGLEVVNILPKLQRLGNDDITAVFDNSALKKPSKGDFAWQQKAVAKIDAFKKLQTKPLQGAFVVNMASTGCGKTFANAKIMQALSEQGNSLRFVLALGLRTLTLQTGDEYRERVGLSNSELAVLIGSRAVVELHEGAKKLRAVTEEKLSCEDAGSESLEHLFEGDIDFDGVLPDTSLATVLTDDRGRRDDRARKFLYAPVLACTIDHMMGATETKRGGRYILPSLRLLSSDLVIDEVDDFTGEDLAAIGRLVHLAGMLGRKVMISSATIPPALAEGFFNAYRQGWELFSLSQRAQANIACIWVDEFNSELASLHCGAKGLEQYVNSHAQFIQKRVAKLAVQPAKRKAEIIPCALPNENINKNDESVKNGKQLTYFNIIFQAIKNKHSNHYTVDIATQKNVSFGVVRVANINLCVDLTRYLLECAIPDNTDIRVMAYHSQQILLMRHEQEQHLDAVLKRKEKPGEPAKAFSNPVIREHLDSITAENIIFILVATPVEEVGRDHDFDWAVVEPSSYRSIIQLAGRVRRHRAGEASVPNMGLLQYNWKAFENNDKKGRYFVRPGYESEVDIPLPFHDLARLIDQDAVAVRLDATPRVQIPLAQGANQYFTGIEHRSTRLLLTAYENIHVDNLQGYLQHTWWLTGLPQTFQCFRKAEPTVQLFYVWNDKKSLGYWAEKDEDGEPVDRESQLGIEKFYLSSLQLARLWFLRDYETLLNKWSAASNDMPLKRVSLRFGELNMREGDQHFNYNAHLGLFKRK
ncbi:MAG: CRISPR-associated endonuclease/helicase Cas3 [Flavobacteriales bacterium]|jgi:CRISPR-associated endonuclease/helicase Cas3